MSHPETVLIVGQDGGPLIINAADYDQKVHTLFSEKNQQKPRETLTVNRGKPDNGANR